MDIVVIVIVTIILTIAVFGSLTIWMGKPEKEVETVEELETVNRPLTDFRSPGQKEEELLLRVQRLENAILLIEQAFGWVLIPEDGEEEIVTVVEKVNAEHIEFIPAILVNQGKQEPIQPDKPIRPRFLQ